MKKLLFLLLLLPISLKAQNIGPAVSIYTGAALPSICSVGQLYVATGTPAISLCTATDTWTNLSTGLSLPSGSIVLISSGSCPTGTTEQSGLDGKTLFGTINSHSDVGGTGGADSIVPPVSSLTAAAQTFTGSSSTVSAQTFTGSALGTHTHTLTATGTNGTSSVTGTLNSFDNRSAYMKVIFCKAN